MQRFLTLPALCVVFAILAGGTPALGDNARAEVIVLSTLHQLHGKTRGYSFDTLTEIIEWLEPNILAVELTPADLASRREQGTKQEYQRSVFPLLEENDYAAIALEPAPPLYDELVGMLRQSQQELANSSPENAALFDVYVTTLFEYLGEYWDSPVAVNSTASDMLFESKHRFQSKIFGPVEATVWERWNEYFLQQILTAAADNPGKRIVVLVGAEHAYWLRSRLDSSDVTLLDTERLLTEFGQ
jgi:hypothetical protein